MLTQAAADDHFNDHVIGIEIEHVCPDKTNYQGTLYSDGEDMHDDTPRLLHAIIPACNDKADLV